MSKSEKIQCRAFVSVPPYYIHAYPCENHARYTVGGYSVCGTHKRVAEKWDAEGHLDSMVKFCWVKR